MKGDVSENRIFGFLKRLTSWTVAVFAGSLLLLNLINTARAWGNNGEDGLVIKLQSPVIILFSAFLILIIQFSFSNK